MKDHTSGGAPPVVEEYGTRVGQVGGACVGQKCQQSEDRGGGGVRSGTVKRVEMISY